MPSQSSRREFLRSIALGAAALTLPGCARLGRKNPSATSANAKPPNFVFILSDDQGWSGSSVRMNPDMPASASDFMETPNLERMAREGMRFGNAYSPAAMCSPTRYAIQYGQTPARLHRTENSAPDAEALRRVGEATPIPKMLKAAGLGYVSAHFGKWHMVPGPDQAGYDEHDGPTGNREGNVLTPPDRESGVRAVPLPEDDPKRIFSLTAQANDFMERQVAAGNPFFLQISHYAIHLQLQARPETLEHFENKDPGTWHHRPLFAACTKDLDTGVGQLLDKIDALGIADNTYVIYMSDNGALAMWEGTEQVNMPLRRGKFTLFEGGIRVPMIIKGPGIAANSASETLVWGCDILPTIHDLSGSEQPLPKNLDGVSWRPLIASGGSAALDRWSEGLFFHCPSGQRWSGTRRQSSLRIGDWKILKNYYNGDEVLLFNLADDPYEWNDLSGKMPLKRDEMKGKLEKCLAHVGAVDATMPPDEVDAMQQAFTKGEGFGYRPNSGKVTEYPVPSFCESEKNPIPRTRR